MLQKLIDYGRQQGVEGEPGFVRKSFRFMLSFDAHGRFLGCHDFGREQRVIEKCPEYSHPELIAAGGPRCHPFVESLETVTLLPPAGGQTPQVTEKMRAKHAYFQLLLRQAAVARPGLAAVADALKDPGVRAAILDDLVEKRAKSTDKAAIELDGVLPGGELAAHEWWRQFRGIENRPEANDDAHRMVDLASGASCSPVRTHPKIRGLASVGGLSTGDALVSFDKDAYASLGLEQGCNAAVSGQTAAEYTGALNHLLSERSHAIAGAKFVYWFSEVVPVEEDPIHPVIEGLPDVQVEAEGDLTIADLTDADLRVSRFLAQLRTGVRQELRNYRYYTLLLNGAAGRVMVRDWSEGRFEDLAHHVADWFEHLQIVDLRSGLLSRPPKFWAVLSSLVRDPKKDIQKYPSHHANRLWRAAVAGSPIPETARAGALARTRIDITCDNPLRSIRFGLIKAFLIRKGDKTMGSFLNEEHPDPAYHCGRLMALLAEVQRAALGDVGAGVVQRYYPSASTTPSLVLGRLLRNAQFHLDKIASDREGLSYWFNSRIADVLAKVGDRFPTTLSLDEQSLFALGYYQQLAARSQRRESGQG